MFIAERMQALGPLATEKRKLDNLHNFCLDVIVTTTAHISLARASHVTTPNSDRIRKCRPIVCPEEGETEYLVNILGEQHQ